MKASRMKSTQNMIGITMTGDEMTRREWVLFAIIMGLFVIGHGMAFDDCLKFGIC